MRLFGPPATCGRMRLWRGKCYRWQWKRIPLYWHLSNAELLPPQVSSTHIPLVARFSCSEKPPEPGVGCAALSQGLCDPHSARGRAVVGAAGWHLWELHTGLSTLLRKRRWGISGGSLIRHLLFPNFWRSWSGWAEGLPGSLCVTLGEVAVLLWHWRCLQTPLLWQLSRLPAACPNCGCAATKQIFGDFHKGCNQRSIPCFLICAEWVHL